LTDRSSLASRLIGSRATLLGAQNSLENVATWQLDDGCLCFVIAQNAHYELRRDATGMPSPPTTVKPIAGPGLWHAPSGGSITVPFPVSYIGATGIPDGNVILASGGLAVWGPVPTAFAINSFSHSPTLVQVGQTVTNPAFTASYNQTPTAATLTDTEGHSDNVIGTPTAFNSPHVFTKTVFNQSVTFTLTASNALGSANAGVTITWGENVYFGAQVAGTINQAFITALTAALKTSASGSYAISAGAPGANKTSYFCALTSIGLTTASFTVGGFPFACSKVGSSIPVTNAQGITENFDVFGSDNVGLGDFNLVVS
jgi:hypothetical protein